MATLAVSFTGLRFENPILLVSAPPTESENNILRAFDAGWGGVVTKTIGLHPVVNVAGPKTGFFRATPDSTCLSMKKRSGTVVNISSIVGIHGNWGQTNYAASKAGIIGFTKSLARELGSRNVRANVVAPGYVKTQLTDVLPEEATTAMLTTAGVTRSSSGASVGGSPSRNCQAVARSAASAAMATIMPAAKRRTLRFIREFSLSISPARATSCD